MNNYFDHNEDFSKGYRILDERYIGVWSFIGFPEPAPAPAPLPVAPPSSTPSAFVPSLAPSLPNSGSISLQDIEDEFGGTGSISISEYYGADTGVPGSGTISISDFYGTASGLPPVSFGYYIGGRQSPTANSNEYQRIQYSNDTLSIRPATLSSGRESSGVVEDTTYGYICGGYVRTSPNSNSTNTNNINRFQFSNETSSNPPANLPTTVYGHAGISSPTKGFICGGNTPSNPTAVGTNLVQEINLSNGTTSNPPTVLATPATQGGKLNDKGAGYIMVALATNPTTFEPSVNKLRFSDTTVSTMFATALPGNPSPQESFTNRSGGKGYVFGGFKTPAYTSPSFYSTKIERLVYSTDTWGITTATNNVNGRDNVGLFSDTIGYIAGAFIPSNSFAQYRDVWNKFAFSTETFVTSTSPFAPTCYSAMFSTQV